MNLSSMEFEGLLSYRHPQQVPLDNLGLVLIRGRNEVSHSADSNGVGKTALSDILSLGWYGVTLRGKRGDEVACRFTSGPGRVVLSMIDELGAWSITRTVRPTTLHVEGCRDIPPGTDSRIIQERIEQRIGFGFRTFRNAVIFGQGNFERFAQAEQADQMRMLDEIQGLDFREALDRAKQWRDSCRNQVEDTQVSIQRLEATQQEYTTLKDNLLEAQQGFNHAKNDRLKSFELRLKDTRERTTQLKQQLKSLLQGRQKVQRLRVLWAKIQDAQRTADTCKEALRRAENTHEVAQRRLREKTESVTALLKASQCPTCRVSISGSAATQKRIKDSFAPELLTLSEEATRTQDSLDKCTQEFTARSTSIARALEHSPPDLTERSLGQQEGEVSERKEQQVTEEITRQEHEEVEIEQEIEGEKSTAWDGQSTLQGVEHTLVEIAQELPKQRKNIERFDRTLHVAEYWVEAFGDRGLRSLLFDSVAGFLNTQLSFHLMQLAGGEVCVEASGTRALKGGGVKERLSLTASWDWGGVGIGVGSAGQDRRVDLALFAALQDLAEARSARPFPLKIWDEPADALDARGQEMFARWVEQEARKRGTGFLVTHSLGLESLVRPDHVWTVVLSQDGSRVEQA